MCIDPFAAKLWMELECKWDMYIHVVTNSVISKSVVGKINSDNCSLMSNFFEDVSCLIASQ